MKKIIALAIAAALISGPAFAQVPPGPTNGFVLNLPANSVTTLGAASTITNFGTNTIINGVQASGTGIPAGTNQQIDAFQIGANAANGPLLTGNPAPNVMVPFSISLTVKTPIFQ